MAGVRGSIALSLDLTDAGSGDLGSPKMRVSVSKALALIEGTDATNKANIFFADTRTVAISANENIEAAAANVNSVQVTRPASNGFIGPFMATGDGVSIKPGEYALFVSQSGWAVTAATGDLLNIANSGAGTSVTYDLVIVARTVAA